MKKLYILTLILCLLQPFCGFAKGGEETLEGLLRQCDEARSLSQYDQLESLSQKLLATALEQKNERAEAYANFYNGLAKLFLGKGDDAIKTLENANILAEKCNNDSVKALVHNSRGIYYAMMQNNSFVAQQYFFRSLEAAKRAGYEDLQYRVRGNLLTLSHAVGGQSVLENAEAVYDYGVKHKNDEQISLGAYYLATYYYKNKDYAKSENYLKIALDTYERYPYEDIASVYSLYAKMLVAKGEISRAEEMAKRAISLSKQYNQVSMEVDACIAYAEVLYQKHSYEESIAMVEQAMAKAEESGLTNKSIDCYQILAQNLSAQGKYREAAECLEKANDLLNNQSTINMERLTHEQQVMHDIEQKEAEAMLKQEQIVSQRRFLLMLGVIIVILIVLLISIFTSNRRRKVLYKKIVLQNTRAIARQEEMQEQIQKLMHRLQGYEQAQQTPEGKDGVGESTEVERKNADDATAKNPSAGMDEDKIDALYTQLCHLMNDERLFTEPQLTREKMAERLGTNRTYLIKVIKEKTGMNYLQFINSYRINEAIKILSDKDKLSYPLKQIWSDLGFNSPSTFFKLFQQTVGITPSTYRKQFLEVKDEDQMDDME